jgi:hypothetical protein
VVDLQKVGGYVHIMNNAKDILNAIGPDAICVAVGVKKDAVRKAKERGVIPSAWYFACCNLLGEDLPREAFSFKGLEAAE